MPITWEMLPGRLGGRPRLHHAVPPELSGDECARLTGGSSIMRKPSAPSPRRRRARRRRRRRRQRARATRRRLRAVPPGARQLRHLHRRPRADLAPVGLGLQALRRLRVRTRCGSTSARRSGACAIATARSAAADRVMGWQAALHFGFHLGLTDWLEFVADSAGLGRRATPPPTATTARPAMPDARSAPASTPARRFTNVPPPNAAPLDWRARLQGAPVPHRHRSASALAAVVTLPFGDDSAFLGDSGFTFRPELIADFTRGAVHRRHQPRRHHPPRDHRLRARTIRAGDGRAAALAHRLGHELTWSAGVAYRFVHWVGVAAEVYGFVPLVQRQSARSTPARTSPPTCSAASSSSPPRTSPSASAPAPASSPRRCATTTSASSAASAGRRPRARAPSPPAASTPTATASPTRRTSARPSPRTRTASRTRTAAPISTTIRTASPTSSTSARTSPRTRTASRTTTAAPTSTTTATASPTRRTSARTIRRTRTASRTTTAAPISTTTATASPTRVDKCPNEPETRNGVDDDDGCPDSGGQVIIAGGKIELPENILFETGSRRASPAARESLMERVAEKIKPNPQVQAHPHRRPHRRRRRRQEEPGAVAGARRVGAQLPHPQGRRARAAAGGRLRRHAAARQTQDG